MTTFNGTLNASLPFKNNLKELKYHAIRCPKCIILDITYMFQSPNRTSLTAHRQTWTAWSSPFSTSKIIKFKTWMCKYVTHEINHATMLIISNRTDSSTFWNVRQIFCLKSDNVLLFLCTFETCSYVVGTWVNDFPFWAMF